MCKVPLMLLEGFWRRTFKNMGKCSAYKVLLVQLLSQKAVSCEGGGPWLGQASTTGRLSPCPSRWLQTRVPASLVVTELAHSLVTRFQCLIYIYESSTCSF